MGLVHVEVSFSGGRCDQCEWETDMPYQTAEDQWEGVVRYCSLFSEVKPGETRCDTCLRREVAPASPGRPLSAGVSGEGWGGQGFQYLYPG